MKSNWWRTSTAVLLCGGVIVMLSFGIRHSFGIFLRPMTLDLQWTRATFAFAIALQNLVWGFSQPVLGAVADRYGPGKVLTAGGLLYALGLALMSRATSGLELALSAGLLVGLGLGGTYAVVFGVVGRSVPVEKRSLALGILTALASFGQFAMLPLSQNMIAGMGWSWALLVLAASACLVPVLAIPLSGSTNGAAAPTFGKQSVAAALAEVRGHSGFWLVWLGFFVCGFQVVFVATHLPSYLLDKGMSVETGMMALALIGLANIPGAYLAGYFGGKFSKKYLLSGVFVARALIIAAFLITPVTPLSVYAFATVIGLVWFGTVPLVNGIVAQIFGVQYFSMLVGLVFVGHQIGSFLGGWLGGLSYELTGSYLAVWMLAIGLSLISAVLNAAADDQAIVRLVPAQASA